VAMLIGLWIYDSLSYNTCHLHYDRLGQVMNTQQFNGVPDTSPAIAIPLSSELKNQYKGDLVAISLASWSFEFILAHGENKVIRNGMWVEPGFPAMLGLQMLSGTQEALDDPSSMLISQSLAQTLFGMDNPLHKTIKIRNKMLFKVAGVFKDFPHNSSFHEVAFCLPWKQYFIEEPWLKEAETSWGNHSFQLFVQLAPLADFKQVSQKIRFASKKYRNEATDGKEEFLIHPMCDWHLYSEFKNGVNAGGRIQFVWLFGIIGCFVLLLACINFMNLSTARSEKRAREVGVRKAIGSHRYQLIGQFLSESLLMAFLALGLALLMVQLSMPWFNQVSGKVIELPWLYPIFWLMVLGFTLFTGLLAGSYPAFYLSSFDPVRVLKGTFRAGKLASLPRKILVVLQFTVSIALIIGTAVVYRQIQFAKDRPVGYNRDGLITVSMNTPDFDGHYQAIRIDLLASGGAENMAQSFSPSTEIYSYQLDFNWQGKDPNAVLIFGVQAVSVDFGKTVGWNILLGRDFSKDFPSDTGSVLLNESAVKLTGLQQPVGETLQWNGRKRKVVGVLKDMVMESPFKPIKPTVFFCSDTWSSVITVRLKAGLSAQEALRRIEPVFKKYNPGSPFEYKFVDEEYSLKFAAEERIGSLSGVFSALAIFISYLGLFGLASFMAEQRTKEIGVRKVLGASVFNLWLLLSKDFLLLVLLALCVASPLSWYYMKNWLEGYQYRSALTWWIFAGTGAGALLITLLTVSYQAIRAAQANPIKSLRTE
jgi:putative ABC transport system permease protein